jgi:hypothetical protein
VSNYNPNFYGGAYRVGYSYDKWDIHEMEYVGKLRNYSTHAGFMEFLDTFETVDDVKNYFTVKEMIKLI